jgi:hypothetical protein
MMDTFLSRCKGHEGLTAARSGNILLLGDGVMHMPLSPNITIEELVATIPQAPGVLRRFGIVCIQCGEPVWGTLEEVAREKGIQDLTPVLAALAEVHEQQEAKQKEG